MFDFSRAFDIVSAALGGTTAAAEAGAADDALATLTRAGIDPAMLEGLTQNEIVQLLGQHGLDPAALAGDRLAELAAQFGSGHPLADLASQFLGGARNSSA